MGRGKRSSTGLGRPAISVISRARGRAFGYRTSAPRPFGTLSQGGPADTPRLGCSRLSSSREFLRLRAVDAVHPSPASPRHFFPMFKIDELARERGDRFDSRFTRPRQRFVENSRKIPRKSVPYKFPTRYPAAKLLHYLRLTFIRVSRDCLSLETIELKCSLKVLNQ